MRNREKKLFKKKSRDNLLPIVLKGRDNTRNDNKDEHNDDGVSGPRLNNLDLIVEFIVRCFVHLIALIVEVWMKNLCAIEER